MTHSNFDDQLERIRNAQDVNELLAIARTQGETAVQLPLEDAEVADDAAADLALGMLSNWILFFGPASIEGRAQVDPAIEALIAALRNIQTKLPNDDGEVKNALLHEFKRQLIGPHHPLA